MSTEVTVQELPNCDVCLQRGVQKEAHYDAATRFGPWAYLCNEHFAAYAFGLGTGRGQRLVVQQ